MESFFSDDEVKDLAENHLEAVSSLEEKEATRVMKAYKRVRTDLRDRLDALNNAGKTGTFSAQQLRGALLQVDLALEAMTNNLSSEIDSSAQLVAEVGLEHLIKELEKWNKVFTGAAAPINLNVVAVATDAKNFLFNQKEASLQAYSGFIRAQFAKTLTDGAIEQTSMGQIVSRMGSFFLGEEWRMLRLVRTELHNVYSQGKMRGMLNLWDEGEGDIPDLKKTLFHPMDHRTGKDSKRLAQNNPIVPINEPFIENSTGKELIYMAPPNRPNDRAILIPFREEWKN